MSEIAGDQALAQRLEGFVNSFRGLRAGGGNRPELSPERLGFVLDRLRPELAAVPRKAAASPPPTLEPASLITAMAQIGPALSKARAEGAFIDPWAVMRLERKELANAAALRWILDPRGSHGMGSGPLTALCSLVNARTGDRLGPAPPGGVVVTTEHRPMWSERDRVDLALHGPDFLLFVEVKIDAVEGPEQISRYLESAETSAGSMGSARWAVAYLTAHPAPSVPAPAAHFTWRDLVRAIRSERPRNEPARIPRLVKQLLDHFEAL